MGYRWIRAAVVVVGWWCRASVVVQDKVVSMVSHPRIRGSTKLHSPSSDMFFARRYCCILQGCSICAACQDFIDRI
uniref:Secreted protein n=1 Tax=Helianthus annuus TaxID=4232 RepID=A0A251SBA1_HELAN